MLTFGASDPDQVLSKVLEMQEMSRLVEDELQRMQEALNSKSAELEQHKSESQAKLANLESQLR